MACETQQPHQPAIKHVPVLLREAVEWLNVIADGRYIDATFGGGGHTRAILDASSPSGQVLALDADPAAVDRATEVVTHFPDRLTVRNSNFSQIGQIARDLAFVPVDGVLLDLGLSSFQFDEDDRGFSFHSSSRLDMRLDPSGDALTAWDVVNNFDEDEIADIIFHFGEEHRSRRIAREIVRRRQSNAIETSSELAAIVERAVGGRRGAKIHPATKTFQAIRIAVNQELESLEHALVGAVDILAPGGRLVVISFHSLEDRIVKQFLQRESRDCVCPPELPVCRCDHRASLRILTRKPVRPGPSEIAGNPRSRSAVMRAAERLS